VDGQVSIGGDLQPVTPPGRRLELTMSPTPATAGNRSR
jgi:hypothetical protein